MGRLLLALLVGLVGALIVHIAAVLLMPRMAEDSAWARLSLAMPEFAPTLVSPGGTAGAEPRRFGYLDPAFVTAACRVDVSAAPVRLSTDAGGGFWSAALNTRAGDNVFSINERLALEGRLDLFVGTADQIETARLEGVVLDEETIPVVVNGAEFYLTLRGLVDEPSRRPFVEAFMRSLACAPVELAPAGPVAAR